MKILLHSRFYPNIGGIETVAELLTREWHRAGAEVIVISDLACGPAQRRAFGFPIYYRPGPILRLRLLRWADVFVHMNLSLRALWPWFFCPRPLIAVNHAYYHSDRSGRRDWRERLKLRALSWATNIAVSAAVADRLPQPCAMIPNPVDVSLFQTASAAPRSRELVFLGRLVSDKGCDLLLHALSRLRRHGLRPKLTIIGGGPERATLEQLTTALNLQAQVDFAGAPSTPQLASLLCQHEIMVIPSLWEESFGVVALEGAACGCVVIGSDGGGLPDAIGPAGITFRRGDLADLTAQLAHLLSHREAWPGYRQAATAHIAAHRPASIAQRYLEIFARVLAGQQRAERAAASAAAAKP